MLGARRTSSGASSLASLSGIERSRAGTGESSRRGSTSLQLAHLEAPSSLQLHSSRQIPLVQSEESEGRDSVTVVRDQKSWAAALFFEWRHHKLWLRRLCFWASALAVFLFCFALAFVLPHSLQRLAPVVIGSLLSFISSLVILVSYLFQSQNRRYPNELLVYVAICEFGLALLALVHVMMYCWGSDDTSSSFCEPMSMHMCSMMSALEMFLLLASVGWFGAAILHLFVSVSNPFANYKSQLKMYHSIVWTGSIVISVAVPLVIFSKSFQDRYDMSSVEICRAVGLVLPMLPSFLSHEEQEARIKQWQSLNMEYWGTLFVLVVLLVVAAQSILVVGWWRSNSGTVIALKARRRMMKRMTIYVHTLNATWLIILVAFFVYRSNNDALQRLPPADQAFKKDDNASNREGVHFLNALFHFLLAAKGYFTCVVWVSVNKHCCAFRRILFGGFSGVSTDGEDDDSNRGGVIFGNDGNFNSSSNNVLAWNSSSFVSLEAGTVAQGCGAFASGREPLIQGNRSSLQRTGTGGDGGGGRIPRNNNNTASTSSLSSWASQNNETLQREIIYYTVCGITKAILKSVQSSDANIFFQQLLVGAERDSAFTNNSIISHVQNIDIMSSPLSYCQPHFVNPLPPFRRVLADSLHTATDSANSTPANSFSVQRTSFLSTSSQQPPHSQSFNGSFVHQHGPGRFSLYPVSQVPFELFDQEIELQSNRSSSPLGLSPLFAGIRRTATAFGAHPPVNDDVTGTANNIEDPKPKVFIDYAPGEFRAIRLAFGLSDEMYLASFRTTAKERISAGSSGAFMFFSGDNSLIVKSMKEKECRKLVKMIPAYAEYIQQHPKSRIIRFFGCHRIRLYGRNFYFVVMSNVLHSVKHTATITEKYDVKGSWIDRRARRPQSGDMVTCSECNATYELGRADASMTFPFHLHRPDTILKDLDLQRKLHLPRVVAESLHAQLVSDAEFLNSMGIMDYSLLIGIHKCRLQESSWPQGGAMASVIHEGDDDEESLKSKSSSGSNLEPLGTMTPASEEVYFVGIIDILQEWNWEKQMEKVGKMLLGKSGSGISAVAPDAYCERFKARVAQILLRDCEGKLEAKPNMHVSASDTMLSRLDGEDNGDQQYFDQEVRPCPCVHESDEDDEAVGAVLA
uniref:PIPK domain-containing protein n=1 Tax=Globisporangium ultimum (strain ATCC 200006 / CBS 805.95 / DAOM BR144) TaxID=431595 RepID=K3WAN4_GLOUD